MTLSITEIKQVKADYVPISSGSNITLTNAGLDSDRISKF